MNRYVLFIEDPTSQHWWTGVDWTADPHFAKQFTTAADAHDYLLQHYIAPGLTVTEHEFVQRKEHIPEQEN